MLNSALVLAVAGGLAAGPRLPAAAAADTAPRLVVLIVVDQLRPDELLRYRAEWTGGFRRLLYEGVVFPEGEQDHAITQTAPGHSTLLSGRYPAHTGIVTNNLGVPDSLARLIGDSAAVGASPRRFEGTTLADWLIARDSATRILSVSRKDRGAILPVGRSREQVLWWSELGFFTTSRYYRDTLPAWVQDWNARRPVEHIAGRTWDLVRPAADYAEADSLRAEQGPDRRATFPHRLPDDVASADSLLMHFPWMDSLTIDLALDGVGWLGIGAGADRTDLLSLSLSTVDEVGHDYGPDSREMHDMLLRLDHWLGWFMDSLSATTPASRTLLVLTADHGVQDVPEQAAAGPGFTPARAWPGGLVRDVGRGLRARWRTDFGIRFDYGLVTADVAALRARGVDTDSLARELARRFSREPYVERVYTPRGLRSAPQDDMLARRWRHSLPAGFGWLVVVTPHQGTIWSSGGIGTNHGTPWQMDVRIPIVFWGDRLAPRTVSQPIRSVDIAPTLARLVGVAPTERLDGVVLPEVARRTR